MAEFADIQSSFLQLVKNKLPPNLSFVDELAEKLNISRDSAYRRIRGETTLSFNEIKKLSTEYNVSVDNLLNLKSDLVTFNNRSIHHLDFPFDKYLQSILDNLITINQFQVKELIYAAKDIPLFHYFQFPKLTAFKIFFWRKTYLEYPDYIDKNFSFDDIDQSLITLGNQIWEKYLIIPSVEIWSDETINITLRQIEYYFETGIINKMDAINVCEEYENMIKHIQKETALGKKFFVDREDSGFDESFKMYFNEVSIADTTVSFIMDDIKITFITYNNLNILNTSNVEFCERIHNYLKNIIKKSIPISSYSERERKKFFKRMIKKIANLKDSIVVVKEIED